MPKKDDSKKQPSKFQNELSNISYDTVTKAQYERIMKDRVRPIGTFIGRRKNNFSISSD